PLASADASLERVGGKGRSLATLAAAGLPVPAGFLVTTTAYKDFVEAHKLQGSILEMVGDAASQSPNAVERASASIRSLFEAALPAKMASAIGQAYSALAESDPPVAVRSSATAEDLPGLSFAGQQDTFLNVRGEAALLDAVRRCWASLWTARAIGYREQMEIDHRAVAMGVVIQLMVPADVAGILFTANPATGERSELLVNASFGLGEAIVGGQVTPDTYILDRTGLDVKETVIGAKEEMIVSEGDQGTAAQPVPEARRSEASLSAETLGALGALSLRAEALFDGQPQDIEWAVADGTCWLLQSRAITSLPAPPLRDVRWDPPTEGMRLIRRQVVENMPDPLSPLFAELYLNDGLEQSIDQLMANFAVPFDVDEFIERPMFLTVNGFAYTRADYRVSWRMLRIMPKVLYWSVTAMPRLLRELVPRWHDEGLPRYRATVEQWKAIDPAEASDAELLAGVRSLAVADAVYWFDVTMVIAGAKMTDGLLNLFVTSRLVPGDLTSGVFLRGFPSKTLEAQADLEAIARRIEASDSLRELVIATPAGDLLEALERQPAGHSTLEDLQRYLDAYGHQIYTLDFVQPTQAEDPLPVLLSLKALVNDGGYNIAARQTAIAEELETRVKETLSSLGPVRRWLFKKFLAWAQNYGPHREEGLFYLGAGWPTLRRLALELGRRLVASGTFATPEDVFYLESAELETACNARSAGQACRELTKQAEQRRALREARMRLHPPGMVPEKSRLKFGPIDMSAFETQKLNADDSATLQGFAVSPGKVIARASVILSPADFIEMKPDTILVCPTTTPAWTPLFTQAVGLVTDIGGILAHGSIVAREYGIPAVMGTGNVTTRIVTGQLITVDGDTGTVTLLESSGP
ncbi:MAG: PEP/pyruvate-binding domain-containing protein, partial [Myxococcota bacterium]